MLPSRVHVKGVMTLTEWPKEMVAGRWVAHGSTRSLPGHFVKGEHGILFAAENGHLYREKDQIVKWVFEPVDELTQEFINPIVTARWSEFCK